MAKNQQQHTNVKEQIFETVTTIVDESIKDLGYNITKICEVTNVDEAEWFKYKVKCGSLEMNVVDDNKTEPKYSIGDIVRVTIPNGNYNAKKVIEGLYEVGSKKQTIYAQPYNHFVPMTDQCYLKDSQGKEENSIYKFDLTTTNENAVVMTLFSGNLSIFNNTEVFNSIYLKFNHTYKNFLSKLISGEFIVELQLEFKDEYAYKDEIIKISSLNFVGDPYSSLNFTNDFLFTYDDLIGLDAINFKAYIPDSDNNKFCFENGEQASNGDIELTNISLELGHKYDGQTGIKLYTDNSLVYNQASEDYKKHLKYIWYNVDEKNNFLGFAKGNFLEDSEAVQNYYTQLDLNNIYQDIIKNDPNKEFFHDKQGLDLKFNYDEAHRFIELLKNQLRSLNLALNDFFNDFQNLWNYTENSWINGEYITKEKNAFNSDKFNSGLGQYWSQNLGLISTIAGNWNYNMSNSTSKGLYEWIEEGLTNIHGGAIYPSSTEEFKKIKDAKEIKIYTTDFVTESIKNLPYFQMSHITVVDPLNKIENQQRRIGGFVYEWASEEAGAKESFRSAKEILEQLEEAINLIKRGFLISFMSSELITDSTWSKQTFLDYKKEELISTVYEPVEQQVFNLKELKNQIQLHNSRVKIYYEFRDFLKLSENKIASENNFCNKFIDSISALDEDCQTFFTSAEDADITSIDLINVEQITNWITPWLSHLSQFKELGLSLRQQVSLMWDVPDTLTYEVYSKRGIAIEKYMANILQILSTLTDLGFTSQSSKTFLDKYEDWMSLSNHEEWTSNLTPLDSSIIDIHFLYSNEKQSKKNLWNGEIGWSEVDWEKETYWPWKDGKYVATRYESINIDLSQHFDALSKSQQSFQIVIVNNNSIIKSNIVTFNNYINYNLFSSIPYLKFNYKIGSDMQEAYALSDENNNSLILELQAYEKNNTTQEIPLYDANTVAAYPKLTIGYGNYGIGSIKSQELLSIDYGNENTTTNSAIKNLYIRKKNSSDKLLEQYLFLVCQMSISFEDDILHPTTMAVPIATFSDLQLKGPKMIIYESDTKATLDEVDVKYEIFSKIREVDPLTVSYQIILIERDSGDLEYDTNYLYINPDNKLEVLADYNIIYPYLPILESRGLCKDNSGDWVNFVHRQPLLIYTAKALKTNYNTSNLSSIIKEGKNNIYSSDTINEAGIININHSYVSYDADTKRATFRTRKDVATTNMPQIIKKGQAKLQPTFPYFSFFSDSDLGQFKINLENKAPLILSKGDNGIEFYYDGTIRLFKENLEPIVISYQDLIDGNLGIEIQQIGVIQDNEIISTCN